MSYNPNVPKSGQTLGFTRDPIRTNFQQIQTVIDINHVDFGEANQGKHFKLDMPDQSSSIPSSVADEITAYSRTQSSITMPYYKRDAIATVFPLAPIKAMARFNRLTATTGTIAEGFNLTIDTITTGTVTFTITNQMRTTNYLIILTPSAVPTIVSESSFSVASGNLTFSIILLET